jgi:hypothetical protein
VILVLIDMHCHTKEGSLDARISLTDYLKSKQSLFDGILLTDHNSYRGYEYYKKLLKTHHISLTDTPKVFKGIEYDTSDAGHCIIIVPSKIDTKFLTTSGMPLNQIIDIVHSIGGVIGAAHPYDYKLLGLGNIKKWYSSENLETLLKLDFIEGFNSCGTPKTNKMSQRLANIIDKPMTSGSDTHRLSSLGLATTLIDDDPNTTDDLIEIIKSSKNNKIKISSSSTYFEKAISKTHKIVYNIGLLGCYTNNSLRHILNKHIGEYAYCALREYSNEL